METLEQKIKRQLELEQEGIQLGIQRYRQRMQQSELTELPPGLALMHRAIEPMTKALEEFLKPSRGGGRMQDVRRYLQQFEPIEVAYLTAKRLINAISQEQPIQRVAISLANMLHDHMEYLKFKEQHPGLLQWVEEHLRTSHPRHRRTVILLTKRRVGIEDTKWTDEEKLRIGVKLIELFIEATGLVERVQDGNSRWLLQGTQEAVEWIQRQHARCELLDPVALPMIVKPRPWATPFDGGFLTNAATFRYKLVKTRDMEWLQHLAELDMPLVYQTVNALQETAWRINKRVLEVMQECWRLDNGLGGLPRWEEEELPPKPWSSDEEFERLKQEQPEVVASWKRRATEVYERRIKTRSKRFQVAQRLWVAERFKDEPEIYFVWTLDFRGRLYPVQSFINPQADDGGKALLEFAEGKPLGESGAKWLAIHLANKYGIDKVSFEERIQWVKDHEDEILASADDPLVNTFWADADDPWQFLAACFEWAGYKRTGPSFVSHLPIALDGSCNGLQNFSAMLRDEVGGKAVNLVPSDKPQDVYAEVAKVVSEMVEADAQAGDEMAKLWVGKIDRGIAKRPVMTMPYGATLFGMRDQLRDELASRNTANHHYLDCEDDWQPAMYLAKQMYEGIGRVVIAARRAMDWLQEVARIASRDEKPIIWTTPAGFHVKQKYVKSKVKDIRTLWGKERIRVKLGLAIDTDDIDKRRQANGIAPNFVHSMDASHLMLTVDKCLKAGIRSFAMIHDSYGTHAADTDTLAKLLREAFIEQYQTDVLQAFLDQLKQQVSPEVAKELPPVPPKGNLNLEAVRDSLYFFA